MRDGVVKCEFFIIKGFIVKKEIVSIPPEPNGILSI
jgi:hypothetical protein